MWYWAGGAGGGAPAEVHHDLELGHESLQVREVGGGLDHLDGDNGGGLPGHNPHRLPFHHLVQAGELVPLALVQRWCTGAELVLFCRNGALSISLHPLVSISGHRPPEEALCQQR